MLLFFVWGSSAKRLRVELTLAQRVSANGPAGPEVTPPSMFRGHNFIEVQKPPGRDTSAATGRRRVIQLVIVVCKTSHANHSPLQKLQLSLMNGRCIKIDPKVLDIGATQV